MKFIIVELENGDQEFFERESDALRYAKRMEDKRRHSVEHIAVKYGDDEPSILDGQLLRHLLRSLDNTALWTSSNVINE